MQPSRTAHVLLWVVYALVGGVHLTAMLMQSEGLQRVTQSLLAPLLIGVVLTAVPRLSRTSSLLLLGLLSAWCGDFFSQLAPEQVEIISAIFFLGALVAYAGALAPLWRRSRDPMRIALAIPYGGVVIGLFVACADGAGPMLPLVAAYAVALAVTGLPLGRRERPDLDRRHPVPAVQLAAGDDLVPAGRRDRVQHRVGDAHLHRRPGAAGGGPAPRPAAAPLGLGAHGRRPRDPRELSLSPAGRG